jgi:hypothetical protein
MQPAAIHLPVLVTARPSARLRAAAPAAAVQPVQPVRRHLRGGTLPQTLSTPPMAADASTGLAAATAGRAAAAYRAASASDRLLARGALGIDLYL